jgi:hypothetical protein
MSAGSIGSSILSTGPTCTHQRHRVRIGLSHEMPGVGTDIRRVTTFGKRRLGLKPGSQRSGGLNGAAAWLDFDLNMVAGRDVGMPANGAS